MTFNPHSLSDKLSNLSEMIEDATLDYKFNRDCQRTYPLVTQLETSINDIFDSLSNHSMSEKEIQELTEICRKINEDKVFQLIRDSYIPENSIKIEEKAAVLIPIEIKEEPAKPIHHVKDSIHDLENNNQTLLTTEMASSPRLKATTIGSLHIDSQDVRLTERPTEPIQEEKEEDVVGRVKQLFENMNEEYSEVRIDKAYRVLQEIKTFINENNGQYPEISNITDSYKTTMQDIDDFHTFASQVLHEMQDEKGYHLEKIKHHFTIKYKADKGEKISLKMEGTVNVSLFNLLALVNEPEGFPKWMPFCTDGHQMKQLTRTSKIFYSKLFLPPPVCGREWYMIGAGFDRLEANGSILVIAKSIQHDKDFQQKHGIDVPTKSKITRMEMDYMGMEVIPIAKDKVHVKIVQKMDPKIKYLPTSLLNWMAKKTGQQFLERLLKKATHLKKGSLWDRKIQEDREFYGFLEKKVECFLESHGL